MSPSRRPVVGELYKREMLHSEATYRVVAVADDHVEVEALDVPGLPEGFRMRLTPEAVETMALVGEADGAGASASAGAGAAATEAPDERAAERRLRLA